MIANGLIAHRIAAGTQTVGLRGLGPIARLDDLDDDDGERR